MKVYEHFTCECAVSVGAFLHSMHTYVSLWAHLHVCGLKVIIHLLDL